MTVNDMPKILKTTVISPCY